MNTQTTQSVKVRMQDYKGFIFCKSNLNTNQKINLRSNILKYATPISIKLLIN